MSVRGAGGGVWARLAALEHQIRTLRLRVTTEAGGGVPAAPHASTHYDGEDDEVDVKQLGGFPGGSPKTYLDSDGAFTDPGSAGSNGFATVAVSGQSDVVADQAEDTLTLVAGSNITLTTSAGGDSVTIAASGGSGAWTQLAQTVTSGSATSVDFSSISGSYNTLVVKWIAQNSGAGTSDVGLNLKINNDGTAANYTSAGRTGVLNGSANNTNVASGTSGMQVGTVVQSGTTGSATAGVITIVGYAQTTFHKRVLGTWGEDSTTLGIFTADMSARWASTSAITRLTFTCSDASAFTNGSIFTLYGVN